jgi:predicted nucleotidyltransferase
MIFTRSSVRTGLRPRLAIVAGVLGVAILLPVHVHVENREDELARQERELVQRIAKEKRIDLDSVPSPTP